MMSAGHSIVSPPRCWAEVDLRALRHNAALCRDLAEGNGQGGGGLMAVVKSDAYGHGIAQVVTALAARVDFFGVANCREAHRVRVAAGGENVGILLLGPAAPGEVEAVVAGGFSAVVSSTEEVGAYSAAAARFGTTAKLHAVVDTGMGRIGCPPGEFHALLDLVQSDAHCTLEGAATHFPSADEDEEFTLGQIERFRELVDEANLPLGCLVHLANSAGLIGYGARVSFATLARPGLALYGVSPIPEATRSLRTTLTWKTRITLLREVPEGTGISYGRTFTTRRTTLVATLAAGYGDGYPRHLSGQGAEVLISGRRCPVLGRVTMDQILVDVTDLPAVAAGDEVVLMGEQGSESIDATELAEKAGTIPWEIFTGITSRVERFYR